MRDAIHDAADSRKPARPWHQSKQLRESQIEARGQLLTEVSGLENKRYKRRNTSRCRSPFFALM